MATFKIRYSVSAIPIEINTLSDGVETVSTINSIIEKTFGGSSERNFGTTANNVKTANYNTTASNVDLNTIISGLPQGLKFIYIKILSQLSTQSPVVILKYGTTQIAQLEGVGDVCLIPLAAGSPLDYTLNSPTSNQTAQVEILVAGT